MNAGLILNRPRKRHIAADPRRAVYPDCRQTGVDEHVAIGVLDGEQIHLRRVWRRWREVAPNADRRDEAGSAGRRIRSELNVCSH